MKIHKAKSHGFESLCDRIVLTRLWEKVLAERHSMFYLILKEHQVFWSTDSTTALWQTFEINMPPWAPNGISIYHVMCMHTGMCKSNGDVNCHCWLFILIYMSKYVWFCDWKVYMSVRWCWEELRFKYLQNILYWYGDCVLNYFQLIL